MNHSSVIAVVHEPGLIGDPPLGLDPAAEDEAGVADLEPGLEGQLLLGWRRPGCRWRSPPGSRRRPGAERKGPSYSFHLTSLRRGGSASDSPAETPVFSGRDPGRSCRTAGPGPAPALPGTAAPGHQADADRITDSVGRNIVCSCRRRALLQQRQRQENPRLLRVQLVGGDEAELVVVELDVAADQAGRHARLLRTTTTPFLTAAAAASTAALFMLPLPTPAMTMPLAPAGHRGVDRGRPTRPRRQR